MKDVNSVDRSYRRQGNNSFLAGSGIALTRWGACAILICFGVMVGGCVAQQADVVRIKRELDAKINLLDKSKTSLQQAVKAANFSLEKANVLIARQRVEIQELLLARAEVMDQVAMLKDTDLSQVRGALERNQHLVGELDQKLVLMDSKIQTVESQIQQSHDSLEPLVQNLRTQLTAEEQLRTEQGGKLGEFRTSLVDYQQVLTTLRHNVAQQKQQMVVLQQHVDRLGQQQNIHHQQIQTDVKDVRQDIQSVVGTLEQISTTFSGRLDDYEQQRSNVSMPVNKKNRQRQKTSLDSPSALHSQGNGQTLFTTELQSSSRNRQEVIPQSNTNLKQPNSQTYVTHTSLRQLPVSLPTRSVPVAPVQTITPVEHESYQHAFNMLRVKNYDGAAKAFAGFLRAFPDSPLAANSQYWLGECYYGQRRFQEAIGEFERVFALYPTSNKVPASLLKIGYSHLEQQHPSMARSVFQQLVRIHPQSKAAIKAHGRLQEVNAVLHNPS